MFWRKISGRYRNASRAKARTASTVWPGSRASPGCLYCPACWRQSSAPSTGSCPWATTIFWSARWCTCRSMTGSHCSTLAAATGNCRAWRKAIQRRERRDKRREHQGDSMSNPLFYLHEQLEQWRVEGTYQRLRILETASAAEARFDGKQVINLASNNYLGLTTHPKLREAALEAIRKFGVGSGAVRTISGTMSIHMQLEERIAAFKKVEACVVFQSGFAANAGTVAAILGPEDHIVSDELNHASIIDGCRLSRAKIHVFRHKDAAAAEKILGELDSVPGRKLLITDGVFSMDGDIGALPGLIEAAERHGAMMMVDDAHASGVLGRNGRGTIDHFGLDVHASIQVGTLSKAIGVLGGYVCGSRDLIEFLYHRARPFLFSTSHPPAVAAACL